MRLEILIDEPNGSKLLLKDHPPKDGSVTQYACGFICVGSWAGRLEQHKKFVKSHIGRYIKTLENEK